MLNNACVNCPQFSTNDAGDDPSGGNTACECEANRFVQNNQCVSCTGGETNAAGDPVPGSDTTCDAAPVVCSSFGDENTCTDNSECRWVSMGGGTCIDCLSEGTGCSSPAICASDCCSGAGTSPPRKCTAPGPALL